MKSHFKRNEMAPCFRENGTRCRECPLKQPAEKLPACCEESLDALMTEVLEPARRRLGKPIVINSGYRCSVHNATVGGVVNSQHMRGEAADIAPLSGDASELARLVEIIKENGKWDQMIIYDTFVHVSWKRSGLNRKQVLRKISNDYKKQ